MHEIIECRMRGKPITGGAEFKWYMIWQMITATLHSCGQLKTEKDGDKRERMSIACSIAEGYWTELWFLLWLWCNTVYLLVLWLLGVIMILSNGERDCDWEKSSLKWSTHSLEMTTAWYSPFVLKVPLNINQWTNLWGMMVFTGLSTNHWQIQPL